MSIVDVLESCIMWLEFWVNTFGVEEAKAQEKGVLCNMYITNLSKNLMHRICSFFIH